MLGIVLCYVLSHAQFKKSNNTCLKWMLHVSDATLKIK